MLKALIKTMRPRQWPTKNAAVLAPLVFNRQLTDPVALLHCLAAFLLFCLISSAIYIINDLADIEADRQHPKKRFRPIAAGQLSKRTAWIAAGTLIAFTLPISYLLSPDFMGVIGSYLILNLAYSKWLKHIALVDVLVLAACFVLRVAGGVVVIQVGAFSPWLYVITTLLALYLGFGKRRAELALKADGANSSRRVLEGYTIPFLDQLITIVSSCTVIAYSLYTFLAPVTPNNHIMMLTIPFVIYGIFRYLYLVQVKQYGGAPEEVLITDRPLQISIGLWGLSILLIFYIYL
jgi:4-hydroxybenzoate polyprenyltransferase